MAKSSIVEDLGYERYSDILSHWYCFPSTKVFLLELTQLVLILLTCVRFFQFNLYFSHVLSSLCGSCAQCSTFSGH